MGYRRPSFRNNSAAPRAGGLGVRAVSGNQARWRGRLRFAACAALLGFTPAALPAQVRPAATPSAWSSGGSPLQLPGLPGAVVGLRVGAGPVITSGGAPAIVNTPAYVQADTRRSRTLIGAAAGFIIGAGATYLILQQGGSTSLCDRERNQDAIDASYCAGLYALGGVVGAGAGALIGSRTGR
jgi:hypothetical protein